MLNVALTGNIAAGKSTVTEFFRRWGATIIDSDQLVREAQQPGSPVLRAIAERFGAGVILPDGTLDRAALRGRMVADPATRTALNAIVHPEVRRRRAELIEQARARGDRIVISDIPLLFEASDPNSFDRVILVDAPVQVRLERLMASRGLPRAEAEALMATQLPAKVKRAWRSAHGTAPIIIENTGDFAALERRAREVWAELGMANKVGTGSFP